MLKSLAKDAALYAAGTAAVRGIAVLLVPIYTYSLSVSQYGVLETTLVSLQILLILYNAGISQAVVRFWGEAGGPADADRLIGTATSTTLALGGLGALLTIIVGFTLGRSLLGSTFTTWALLGLVASAVARSMHQQCSGAYRAMRRPGAYVIMQIAAALVWLVACYLLVRRLHGGIAGALWSQCIGFGVVAGWGYIATMRTLRLSFHPATAWELLRFGAPLIASAAGWFVLNASDRYFLGIYRNFTEVGQYSLGYRVASLHVVGIITPLQLAFAPMVFEAAKQPRLDERMGHIADACAWIVGLSAGVLAMLAPIAVSLLSPAAYAHSEIYTYWILPSGVFLGVYYWAASLLHLQKRTLWIAGAVSAAAIANIALNLALIPSYGAIGAAIATDIAMLGAATVVTVLALRPRTVRLHRGNLVLATLVSGTLFALAVWLSYAPVSSSVRIISDILAASLAFATAGLTVIGRDVIGRIAGLRWIASRRARSP